MRITETVFSVRTWAQAGHGPDPSERAQGPVAALVFPVHNISGRCPKRVEQGGHRDAEGGVWVCVTIGGFEVPVAPQGEQEWGLVAGGAAVAESSAASPLFGGSCGVAVGVPPADHRVTAPGLPVDPPAVGTLPAVPLLGRLILKEHPKGGGQGGGGGTGIGRGMGGAGAPPPPTGVVGLWWVAGVGSSIVMSVCV